MKNEPSIFWERNLLIATRHGKETYLGPLMRQAFNMQVAAATDFDSDAFGTFSGEIERPASQRETLELKLKAAAKQYQADLVMSSEGAFGPHPSAWYLPANIEMVGMLDIKNDILLVGEALSIDTNFKKTTIENRSEIEAFLENINFPSHRAIVRIENADGSQTLHKGIDSFTQIIALWQHKKKTQVFHLETDMRAMYNPKRQEVIKKAAENLIEKMLSLCPACQSPGFWPNEFEAGLPCEICGNATRDLLRMYKVCTKCKFKLAMDYPNGKKWAEASICDYCNP